MGPQNGLAGRFRPPSLEFDTWCRVWYDSVSRGMLGELLHFSKDDDFLHPRITTSSFSISSNKLKATTESNSRTFEYIKFCQCKLEGKPIRILNYIISRPIINMYVFLFTVWKSLITASVCLNVGQHTVSRWVFFLTRHSLFSWLYLASCFYLRWGYIACWVWAEGGICSPPCDPHFLMWIKSNRGALTGGDGQSCCWLTS